MKKVITFILIFGALFTALIVLGIAIAVLAGDDTKEGSVLHVTLDGAITEVPHHDLGSMLRGEEPMSTYGLVRAIRRAADDEKIVAMVLEIKNPELGFAQFEEFAQAMAIFRERGKDTTAFLETAGEFGRGDGVYALAATAERIVLAPPGDVSLVGLRAEVPFIKGLLKKLNIAIQVEQRHAFKNMANMFNQEKFTAAHQEALSTLLEDLQARWIAKVAELRGKDEETVRQWLAQGPVGAQEALSLGMVDQLDYWDVVRGQVLDQCNGDKERVVSLTTYLERLPERDYSGARIAFITGEGSIHRGPSTAGMDEASIGSDTFAKALRNACEDGVAGVLMRVDSPGGSYIASDLIRREVARCRAKEIPVVASMGNVAASGGYFISMDADLIVAQATTITGSIGVLAILPALREFYKEWLGVTFDTYETAPMAGTFSTLDMPNAAQAAVISKAMDRIYKDFVTKAANGRKTTYDAMHEVAQGRVWSGEDALEAGLVDSLGGLYDAIDGLLELAKVTGPYALIPYPEPPSGLDLLLGKASAAVAMGDADAQLQALEKAAAKRLRLPGAGRKVGVLEVPWVPRF